MAPKQKTTFLPYTRGIQPAALRLGSLYLNFLDPDDGLESKRFEYQEDLTQQDYETRIQPWIWPSQVDEPCSFRFEVSENSSLALKMSDFFKAEGHSDSSCEAVLIGHRGRRLKIKKPEKFLEKEVLTQPNAMEWIKKQASIWHRSTHGNYKFKAPKIWMCTGVQLVTGGDVHINTSRSAGGSLGAAVDVGALAGGPPGVGEVGLKAGHGNEGQNNLKYGHEDERVWAAQFMPVKIEYGNIADEVLKTSDGKVAPADITSFRLEDIADLKGRGIRGSVGLRTTSDGEEEEKVPEPIGNIVITEEEEEQDEGIEFGDELYVEEMDDTDWDMYNKCSVYLDHAQTGRRSPSPEPVNS